MSWLTISPGGHLANAEQKSGRKQCARCAGFLALPSTGRRLSRDLAFSPVTLTRRRRRDRANQVAAANRVLKHYGMRLADWQGSAFVLSTATGKTEIVDNLAHLWTAAERLLGRRCDPLDEELIAKVEGDFA